MRVLFNVHRKCLVSDLHGCRQDSTVSSYNSKVTETNFFAGKLPLYCQHQETEKERKERKATNLIEKHLKQRVTYKHSLIVNFASVNYSIKER